MIQDTTCEPQSAGQKTRLLLCKDNFASPFTRLPLATIRRFIELSFTFLVTAVVVSGCVVIQPDGGNTPAETVVQEKTETVPTVPSEPGDGLTATILNDLLTSNIAAQRGENEIMLESLARAARASGDTRLLAHATHEHIRAEKFNAALALGQRWNELEETSPAPVAALGYAYVKQNDGDAALQQFTTFLKRSKANLGSSFIYLTELISRHKNPDVVIPLMQKLTSKHPDVPEAHYATAFLASRMKKYDVVSESLDEALRLKPGWGQAAIVKMGNYSNLKQLDELNNFAEDFLQAFPKEGGVRLQFARHLVDQNKDVRALREFKTVAEQQPENADAIYAAGLLELQMDNYDSANHYLHKHLELRENHDQTRIYLSEVAAGLKNYDEAIRWLEEIDNGELRLDAQVRIADVVNTRDGLDEGLSYLDAITTDDDSSEIHIVLAREQMLREAGDFEAAREVLDAGLDKFPDDTELLYSRGLVFAHLKLVNEHEQDMRKLIAKQPENAHAYNALGYTLADLTQRYDEARELITKALELRPDDPFILDSMGWVHYRLGELDKALEFLERAMSKREDAEIAAHLGELYWVMGDKEKANSVWERGKKSNPDNQVLQDTIKKLKQ